MQGKKRYLALILFLIIGLVTFSFASPNDELEPVEGNVKKVTDNSNNKVEKTEAEKAVEEAELRPSEETVEEAEEIIEESVTNTQVRQELTQRLEVVEEAIDASELVATVERMVEESEDKDDILASEIYFNDNDVEVITGNMDPGDVKDNLEDRIDTLIEIFEDEESPTISGIESGVTTKKDVQITIEDNNKNSEVTINVTLNNEKIDFADTFDKEGVYVINVVDAAHNPATLTFTIDKTNPKFTNIKSGGHYSSIDEIVVDDATETTINIKNNDNGTTGLNVPLTEDATYLVTATDKAGNSKAIYVAIDNTNPEIISIDGEVTKSDVKVTIKDKFLMNVTINDKKYNRDDFKVQAKNENFSLEYDATEEGVYTINAVDKKGNPATKTFTIDKTAPKFENLASREVDIEYYKVDITDATDTVITLQKNHSAWIEIEEGYELTEEATYQLKAVDAAGNTYTTWIHIDKTAPEIYGVDKELVNSCVSISAFDRYLDTVEIDGTKYTRKGVIPFEHDSSNENFKFVYPVQICDEGTHTIIARDKSGKETIKEFTIDTTKAEINVATSNNGNSTNQDVTVTLTSNEPIVTPEGWTVVEEGIKFTKVHKDNGKFKLTVKDLAGNETPVNYEVKRIDRVAPTATVTTSNNGAFTNKDVTVTIFTNEAIRKPAGWTSIETTKKEHEFSKVYTANGNYEVEITDKAGNKSIIPFTVTGIDRKAPKFAPEKWSYTLEADKDAKFVCPDMSQYVTDEYSGVKSVVVDKWFTENWSIPDQTKPGEFTCRYISTDNAGNSVSNDIFYKVVAPADKTAPIISLIGDENVILAMGETYIESGVKVVDDKDGESTLTNPIKIELFNINDQLVGTFDAIDTAIAGKYVLTYQAKDAAGNVSNTIQRTISIYANVIRTAEDLKVLFSSFDNIKNKTVILTTDIDMSNVTDWKPVMGVDTYTFTLDGNGHKISNLVYETDKKYAGLFFEGMDSGDVTINNLTIENSKVKSTANDSYVGLIGGYIDVINSVNINNVHIVNSEVSSTNYAGAFLGWTAGYNTQNDGPVDGIVNIINSSVKGTKVIGGGSAGLATGHAGANPGTYTTIKNFVAEDNIIKGERVDKTGAIIGTANMGIVVLDNIKYNNNTIFDVVNSSKLVGRFVPAGTGKLTHIVDDEIEFADAITNALSGQVIKLGKDLNFMDQTTTIVNGKSLTLDLNEKTIDGKSTKAETSSLFTVKNGASLNIIGDGIITYEAGKPDTDWGGEGQKEFPGYANNTIKNEGKLVIDGASIFNTTPSGGATFTIDNYPGADLIVEDGIVQQVGGATAIRMFANSATLNTKVTINGGKISGAAAVWLQLPSGNTAVAPKAELVINGGTFSSVKSSDAVYSYSYGNSHANTSVTITGGTFNNGVQFGYNAKNFYDDLKTLSITGGTFNSYVGKWTANHTWVDIEVPTNN